jgi:UDP:flavonoid glycosyltransferase YjiC (YdhE family)
MERCGIDLKTGQPTAEQIRDAVREVLQNRLYRDRARVLGASIANTDALVAIAQFVEATVAEDAGRTT